MSRASWCVLAALAACAPVVAPRSAACLKDYPFRPKIAVLSTVSPRASFEPSAGQGVGLANCAELEDLKILASDGDERGVYNRFVGKKVRDFDADDARSIGLRGRFLLVEAEVDCGVASSPAYRYVSFGSGPTPVLTSLRVLEGTAAYPFRLDDVVTRAEAQHRRLLATREQELRDLVAHADPPEPGATLDEATLACVDTDAGIHVRIRTVVQRRDPPCRYATDCFMVKNPDPIPKAELVSDYEIARDGRIASVRVAGPDARPRTSKRER